MKPLGEVLALAVQYLADKGVSAPKVTAGILLAHVIKKTRIELYMHFDFPLEDKDLEAFRALLRRAAIFEPVEYILSEVEFYGCVLNVSQSVLIPRPETEILVDKAVKKIRQEDTANCVLWDLCTGSGCIGLSVKKIFPLMQVTLADKSPQAVALCLRNVTKNALDVEVKEGDLLAPFKGKKAHYVFCNPPYIAESEYIGLQPSVRDYEPKMALISGATGMEFYERLSIELPEYLYSGAKIFLEIGTGQGERVKALFSASYWRQKEIHLDYAGHERFFFLEIE